MHPQRKRIGSLAFLAAVAVQVSPMQAVDYSPPKEKVAAQKQDVGHTTTWSKAGDLEGFESHSGTLVQVAEGGNPGGFLKTVKTTSFIPKPYLRNNLGKLFGTGPGTISFDLKALDDGSISAVSLFLSTGGEAFRYTIPSKKILGHDQSRADGWVRYSLPWKADWTEEQAIRNGWQPFSGKRDHWSAVIASPIWSQVDVSLVAGKGTGDQAVGIDNFRVEAGKVLDPKSRKWIEPDPAQQKPVAHFAFDEGAGKVLHDRSGNNAAGVIRGATWVRNGGRWALEFDGVDDWVDCGDVRVVGPQTLAAWIYAEPIYSVWLGVPIVGDGSCQIDQHVHDIRAAGSSGFLPFRKWVHVAQTWDGNSARLYVDGTLVSVFMSKEPVARGNFLLAGPRRRTEEEPADYERRFKGKIASVMLYNRALAQAEIHEDLRTSNITNSPLSMSIPQPGLGRIKVEVDAARLGKPLQNVTVTVGLLKAKGDGKALHSATVHSFDRLGRAVVDIDAPALARGDYVLRTTAKDGAGKPLGVAGEEPLAWAGSVQFPSGPPGARRLNNLVTELLRVAGPDDSGSARQFVNPRAGFVFISNRGSKAVKLTAKGAADGALLVFSQDYGDAYETMRYLPKGSYTITTPVAKDLIVRAVAQTVHDYANTYPHIASFSPYAGTFEERHVFPHMNTFLVMDTDIEKPFARELHAKGRRLLATTHTQITPKEGQSKLDAASDKLGLGLGFRHPRYGGYVVDEFAESNEGHRVWSQALERLLSQPRFQGRALHAWTYALYDLVTYNRGEPGREFVRTLQKFDSAVQWECYLDSQRTELAAWRHIQHKLGGETLAAEKVFPGIVQNLIVVPYAYETAGPPWLTMTQPSYDTRTFLEMQIQTVATDPVFAGVRGLGIYRSSYADEETVRWVARLYRHYAIEGRTEPFGKDPYRLTHIHNGDFEEQGRRWQVKPAEEGSIEFAFHHQFGSTQGRYTGRQGDTVLITRRSSKAPNVFSQEIRNLEPGRLYSFRMFSADHKDLSIQGKHAVRIDFENAELVPEKCFSHVGEGPRKNAYLNWHVRVFRAKGKTATLRVSDWSGDKEPGGPLGQELMFNFVKVQPYWPATRDALK
ncbi:MAG: LamG domain-containing protein [Planctomycetes bacterium]|nr:LamG domain-containing protein [Planctomycetota bacterium]